MPRVADWNLPAPAGSGSERRSLPMAQGRSEGSRSPMLADFHTVSLLRVRAVSSRFRCFGCWSETCQPKPGRPMPTGGDTHALAAAHGTRASGVAE